MKLLLSLLFLLPLTAFAEHEATTTVQVHPSVIAISPVAGGPGTLLTKNYMENEIETVIAPATLRAALTLLQPEDAEKLPVTDEAIANLRKKISTKPIRGTDLIQIIARAETKKEAIQLSNAVTNAYIARRKEAEINRAKLALAALDQELLAQSDLVQEHRKELTVLIQQYGIPYFEEGNPSPLGKPGQEMLKNAREKLAQFEVMRDQIEIQVKKLQTLTDDKLIFYAAGLDLPENQVAHSYLQYQEARTEKLALFDQGLDHNDPKITAINNRIKTLSGEIQKEIVAFQENLKTKLELVNRQVKRMSEMVNAQVSDTIDLSLKQNQYNQAKEAYEQTRAMLREMKIKQQEARVLLKMPHDPITIHEHAK